MAEPGTDPVGASTGHLERSRPPQQPGCGPRLRASLPPALPGCVPRLRLAGPRAGEPRAPRAWRARLFKAAGRASATLRSGSVRLLLRSRVQAAALLERGRQFYARQRETHRQWRAARRERQAYEAGHAPLSCGAAGADSPAAGEGLAAHTCRGMLETASAHGDQTPGLGSNTEPASLTRTPQPPHPRHTTPPRRRRRAAPRQAPVSRARSRAASSLRGCCAPPGRSLSRRQAQPRLGRGPGQAAARHRLRPPNRRGRSAGA